MEEKDMDKEIERIKKGIEEGWLLNDEDKDDLEENELTHNTESLFEKYKNN